MRSLLELFGKGVVRIAGEAFTPQSAKKLKPYVVTVALHVRSPNKKILSDAIRRLSGQSDQINKISPGVMAFLGAEAAQIVGIDAKVEAE